MPRKRLLLLVFVVLSLSLMTYQTNRKHLLPFRFLAGVLNGFHQVGTSAEDFVTSPFKKMLLREEENTRLKAQISKMLREEQQWREAVIENKKLKGLLSLKEKEHRYVATARVIARSMDQWSNTVVLDKGLSDGVEKDMIAVTDKGLVGKISGVSRSYSYLLFLSDINFSAAARLQDSRAEGVISGTGFRKCQLKYVPCEEEVKNGDTVITSGLDLLFPQGIPVGYVSKVNKKDVGMFQDIEVVPFTDDAKVEFVAIIKRE
jgi:rod shape-determining protein MreC